MLFCRRSASDVAVQRSSYRQSDHVGPGDRTAAALARRAKAAGAVSSPQRNAQRGRRRSDPSWPVCPGELERPYLRRIDHDRRQTGGRERHVNDGLVSGGRLKSDRCRNAISLPRPSALQATAKVSPDGRFATAKVSLETSMPNHGGVRLIPSLHRRASHPALATVRVRWNGGQRPLLRPGLAAPGLKRSLVRHRTTHDTRGRRV
jgi:hypothetical protein